MKHLSPIVSPDAGQILPEFSRNGSSLQWFDPVVSGTGAIFPSDLWIRAHVPPRPRGSTRKKEDDLSRSEG